MSTSARFPVPFLVLLAAGAVCPAQATWGSWRGSDSRAIGTGKPPTEWDEDSGKNIRWQVEVPGRGSSSPIVWGDRVYVTTAIETEETGAAAPAAAGRGRGGFGMSGPPPTKVYEFVVLAFDRKDGSVAWRKTITRKVPHEGGHATATFASNSSLTDGERLYVYFGSRGLHCLDMKGEVQWSKDFGPMRTAMSFGEGSSPALSGDAVVVNWDHEGESFIAAFDKKTGEERWRRPRQQGTTWATPLIVGDGDQAQVIVAGPRASKSYSLADGKELWSLSGLTRNTIPTPLYRDGVVYLMSGFMGSSLQAVSLKGAAGDLGGTDNVLWTRRRDTPYTPSGLVYGDYVYFLRENSGVLTCLDAATGKEHYAGQKLRRIGTTYSSIVGANDHIYVTSRRGWTKVVKVGAQYEEVAEGRVKDTVDATLAPVGDEIYIRGWSKLYCVGSRPAK